MMSTYCDREHEVVRASLLGALPDDLQAHVAACAICAEVVQVVEALQATAPALEQLRPPEASLIWRRAQQRARKEALARATRPIRIARICALAAGIPTTLWLATSLPTLIPDFDLRHLLAIDRTWSAALTGTTIMGVIATLICISFGSWYVLRQE